MKYPLELEKLSKTQIIIPPAPLSAVFVAGSVLWPMKQLDHMAYIVSVSQRINYGPMGAMGAMSSVQCPAVSSSADY